MSAISNADTNYAELLFDLVIMSSAENLVKNYHGNQAKYNLVIEEIDEVTEYFSNKEEYEKCYTLKKIRDFLVTGDEPSHIEKKSKRQYY